MKALTHSLFLIFCTFLLQALFLHSYSNPLHAEPIEEDEWEAAAPEPDNPKVNWLDSSHGYLTNQTQTLANWMDSFFGDENYDSEQAE